MFAEPMPADPFVHNARAHGLEGDGTTNDQPALQTLVDELGKAYAADGRPRTIYCPSGEYSMRDQGTVWRSGVSLIGAGPAATRFALANPGNPSAATPLAFFTALQHGAACGNHLADCTFAHFEIDGAGMILPEYNVLAKGLGLQYVLRGRFRDLYIHDTPATGFGCDFLQDTFVDGLLAVHCGRLEHGEWLGGAGIGIGTGGWGATERCTISSCTRFATAPTASSSNSRTGAGPRPAASGSSAATPKATGSASPTGAPTGWSCRAAP